MYWVSVSRDSVSDLQSKRILKILRNFSSKKKEKEFKKINQLPPRMKLTSALNLLSLLLYTLVINCEECHSDYGDYSRCDSMLSLNPIEYERCVEEVDHEDVHKIFKRLHEENYRRDHPCEYDKPFTETKWIFRKCKGDEYPQGWYCNKETCGVVPHRESAWEFYVEDIEEKSYPEPEPEFPFYTVQKTNAFNHSVLKLYSKETQRRFDVFVPEEVSFMFLKKDVRLFPVKKFLSCNDRRGNYVSGFNYEIMIVETGEILRSYMNCDSKVDTSDCRHHYNYHYNFFEECWMHKRGIQGIVLA